MSFSSSVKEELSKIGNLANKKNVEKEFIGYLISKNITIQKSKIKFTTESEYNINRFAKLLNNMDLQDYKIEIKGKIYDIEFTLNKMLKDINIEEKIAIAESVEIANEDEAKAVVRGSFLGSGYVSEKTQKNHLEISFLKEENAMFIVNLLKKYNINSKMLQKESDYSIYIKDGEEISKFLAFIGANKSVLNFEEARVQKDMNNKINRIVNCESSNLNKTLNASIEQINAIKHLQETNRFDLLNDKLKEVALARLENPNMSLEELGKKLSGTVGKSGVNYRLNKIIEIANK